MFTFFCRFLMAGDDGDLGHASWGNAAELLLIECLLKAISENRQSDNNFMPSVYTGVAKHLATKGHPFTSTQVKSRWTQVSGSLPPLGSPHYINHSSRKNTRL
jgi:hypothetical protein